MNRYPNDIVNTIVKDTETQNIYQATHLDRLDFGLDFLVPIKFQK